MNLSRDRIERLLVHDSGGIDDLGEYAKNIRQSAKRRDQREPTDDEVCAVWNLAVAERFFGEGLPTAKWLQVVEHAALILSKAPVDARLAHHGDDILQGVRAVNDDPVVSAWKTAAAIGRLVLATEIGFPLDADYAAIIDAGIGKQDSRSQGAATVKKAAADRRAEWEQLAEDFINNNPNRFKKDVYVHVAAGSNVNKSTVKKHLEHMIRREGGQLLFSKK